AAVFLIAAAPSHLLTLSLPDALPISSRGRHRADISGHRPRRRGGLPRGDARGHSGTLFGARQIAAGDGTLRAGRGLRARARRTRSEEHTSELQSRENLVCRLLLEKKK